MKIQEVILVEYEGTLSGPRNSSASGGANGLSTAELDQVAPQDPTDPNGPSPNQQTSGSGFVTGAVTAAVAIAAYNKIMKPARPGAAPTTPPAAYRSPEVKAAFNAETRRAAAVTDLNNSTAAKNAKVKLKQSMIAAVNADRAAGKAPRFSSQQIRSVGDEVNRLTSRISSLQATEIPKLDLEAKSARKSIKNPIKRVGPSIAISNAQKAAIEAKYMASWSWWFKKLLSVLGVVTPLYQLYAEYDRINSLTINPQEKSAARAQAWGVFEAQLAALVVARMAEVRVVAFVVKAIQIGAGIAGGVFSGGASIVASLVGAAATDALVTWLGTDAGRKFLVTHIGWAIQHGGGFAEGFWTGLSDFAKGVSGRPAP